MSDPKCIVCGRETFSITRCCSPECAKKANNPASLRTDTPLGEDGITQEDRDAAARLAEALSGKDGINRLPERFRSGAMDTGPAVQEFSRVRRQAIADTERRCEQAAYKEIERIHDGALKHGNGIRWIWKQLVKLPTSIRSIGGEA